MLSPYTKKLKTELDAVDTSPANCSEAHEALAACLQVTEMAVFGTTSGRRTRGSRPLPLFRNADVKGKGKRLKVSEAQQTVFDRHDAVVEQREEEIALLRAAGRKAVEAVKLLKVKLELAERKCESMRGLLNAYRRLDGGKLERDLSWCDAFLRGESMAHVPSDGDELESSSGEEAD